VGITLFTFKKFGDTLFKVHQINFMLIVLKGIPPSKKNSKRIYCQGKFPTVLPSELHEHWEEKQLWILKKFPKGKIDKCKIYVAFYPSSKRRFDLSNSFESIADLLVKAEIIKDDNIFVLSEVSLKFMALVPKGEERVEILITELL
jgi:Holliday junction resolvase RusA-like endonuclease